MSDAPDGPAPEPTDADVVEAASEAAEGLILERYRQSEITDMDVTVRFEDGTLDVDVYLNAPQDPDKPDPGAVVQEAVEAAESAVDELFEEP